MIFGLIHLRLEKDNQRTRYANNPLKTTDKF